MSKSASNKGTAYEALIITSIRELTPGFKTFTFREGYSFKYDSGQFITLVDLSGPAEIRRSYSIVSSPVLNEPLSIAVKRIDNGFFSRKLIDKMKPGDSVFTTGPSGFFRLPENIKPFKSIFFFAAGSGIVPILSIIKTTLRLYPAVFISLIYSNSSLRDTAFYDELKIMQQQFPIQLHIHFLFSSASDLKRARLNRELLLEFLTINQFERHKTLFYVCGPENYMRMIIFLLAEEGFPKENIRKEDFNPGNKKLVPREPPDKITRQVYLELYGSSFQFPVHYPDSILKAAQKRNLNLPFSCETGKCGSCAARCISGKVWLSDNEVLTDKDLSQGLTLTCTGHPQMGDVILKIG